MIMRYYIFARRDFEVKMQKLRKIMVKDSD